MINSETHRYFLIGDLHDRAKAEGASPKRLARLKAMELHQAKDAREAMRTPFTIADLFATIKNAHQNN